MIQLILLLISKQKKKYIIAENGVPISVISALLGMTAIALKPVPRKEN
jgi:hypothetical protein